MSDAAPLVGLGVKNPDFVQTMSGFMGLKGQQQQLQAGAADLQMRQQDAAQRKALANIDWDSHMSEDGTLDLNSFVKDKKIRQSAGDQYPALVQQAAAIKEHQTEIKSRLTALTNDQLSAYAKLTGGLANDPDVVAGNEKGQQMVKDSFTQFAQMYGMDAAKAIAPVALPLMNNQIPGDKLSKMLQHVQMQAIDTGNQLEKTRPAISTIQGPNGLQMVNTNSLAPQGLGPTGAPIAQGVAPGTTNQAGQFVTGGPQTGVRPVAGNANPTAAQAAAQVGAARGITDRVQQAMSAANNTQQAQDALSRAQAILENPNALSTGASFDTTKKLKNFLSSAGIDTEGAEDANALTKNLARYEGARAAAAGLGGTDAARELAHNGSPNTSIDNKALVGVVKQSLATEKALAAYASKQTGVTDPDQLARNENAFRNIPHLIEGYEYGMSRTPEEANQFLQKHGLSKADMAKTRIAIKQFESP